MIDLMRHVQSWLRKWSEKKASPSIKKHPRDKIQQKRIDSDCHHTKQRKRKAKQNKTKNRKFKA